MWETFSPTWVPYGTKWVIEVWKWKEGSMIGIWPKLARRGTKYSQSYGWVKLHVTFSMSPMWDLWVPLESHMGLKMGLKCHSHKRDVWEVYDQSFMGGGQVEPKLLSARWTDPILGQNPSVAISHIPVNPSRMRGIYSADWHGHPTKNLVWPPTSGWGHDGNWGGFSDGAYR